MSEVLKTLTHKNIKIDVIFDDYGRVKFEPATEKSHYGYRASYDSLSAAKEAIDKHVSAKARITAKALDIKQVVIDKDGHRMTVHGINRNDGSVRVSGYEKRDWRGQENKAFSGAVYPDRQWVRDLLADKAAVTARLREIDNLLDPVEVDIGRGTYGRKVGIDEYEGRMTRMATDLEHAAQHADKVESKPKEVA